MGVAVKATTAATNFLKNTVATTAVPPPPSTPAPTNPPALSERERIRMEYYQTYDVMTGIRIAATLGSFFTMMVLLVLYKSRCKSSEDESLEAAISAAVAEEEELEAVLDQSNCNYEFARPRRSLGTVSTPAAYTRFSSLGGNGGLLDPPTRYRYGGRGGRVSLPTSQLSLRYPSRITFPNDRIENNFYYEEDENDIIKLEDQQHPSNTTNKFLQVPFQKFKYSLCSLGDSASYNKDGLFLTEDEDATLFNHPNIKVTQPTPQVSPSSSNSVVPEVNRIHIGALKAPLASIGSCTALSSIESENPSVSSDSVFVNPISFGVIDDTNEDELDDVLYTTRNEFQDCTNKKYRLIPINCPSQSCYDKSGNHIRYRRSSDVNLKWNAYTVNERVVSMISNLTSTSNQIETSLYRKPPPVKQKTDSESLDSCESLSSGYSDNSTLSITERRSKAVVSKIAIVDVHHESSKKTDHKDNKFTTSCSTATRPLKRNISLSKSDPKIVNSKEYQLNHELTATEMKTLSLKDLPTPWSTETLF